MKCYLVVLSIVLTYWTRICFQSLHNISFINNKLTYQWILLLILTFLLNCVYPLEYTHLFFMGIILNKFCEILFHLIIFLHPLWKFIPEFILIDLNKIENFRKSWWVLIIVENTEFILFENPFWEVRMKFLFSHQKLYLEVQIQLIKNSFL